MDIKSSQTTIQAQQKIDSVDLKINQQLSVTVLKIQTDTQTLTIQLAQSSKSIQVQSNLPIQSKAGQILQLVVTQLTPVAEFKVVNSDLILKSTDVLEKSPLLLKQIILPPIISTNVAKQPPLLTLPANIITAKIIAITGDKIQLQLSTPTSSQGHSLNNQSPLISLSKDQLALAPLNNPRNLNNPFNQYKIGQQLQLEVQKTGERIDYKIIETSIPKLIKGQVYSAKILDITHNKIQLSLSPLATTISNTGQNPNNVDPIISIRKEQLTHSTVNLIKGQNIQLELVKTGQQAAFKILNNQQQQDLQIQQTFKQILPIQERPQVLLNLLRSNLSLLEKNESISKTLKRLSREIIDNLPQTKNITNPSQTKQSLSQSGLFLEANLAQPGNKQHLLVQQDFKARLLKFRRALQQEINVKQEQKTESNELKLLKELQQKTENTIAKIVLNQLNSLPKDDISRQMWILDLPFLNQEVADSASIEINHNQQNNNDNEEQENWSVSITINPPELGTIHCKVTCFDKTINTLFWSDQATTVSIINQHLSTLKEQLEKAGIYPGHLSAHQGTAIKEPHSETSEQSLIDQHV